MNTVVFVQMRHPVIEPFVIECSSSVQSSPSWATPMTSPPQARSVNTLRPRWNWHFKSSQVKSKYVYFSRYIIYALNHEHIGQNKSNKWVWDISIILPTLDQTMTWHPIGTKPLAEPKSMASIAYAYITGPEQDCSISITNALGILHIRTKPLI